MEDVFDSRRRKVAKRVDHIYALLGLAEGQHTAYRKEIIIDYSPKNEACPVKLYIKFGKLVLREEEALGYKFT